jgi:hypothetical protein
MHAEQKTWEKTLFLNGEKTYEPCMVASSLRASFEEPLLDG